MKQARFLEPAEAELEEHVAYFDRQVAGLGERFEQEVRFAISLISEHPKIGPPLTKRIRKLRLRTFPYNIIYAAETEGIVNGCLIVEAPERG